MVCVSLSSCPIELMICFKSAPIPPPPTMAQPINPRSNSPPPAPRSSPSEPPDPTAHQSLGRRSPTPDGIQNHARHDATSLPSTSSQKDDRDPAPSKPKGYTRPNPRTGGRTRWAVGDVIKLIVGGATRQVRIRQKGPNPSSLVLTWLRSREPVLSMSGAPIPLPPFDKDLLVTPGPIMPALDLDCFIRDQPLPPFIPFEEILSGMHTEYLRKLFAENPEDPPMSSESDYDEIDDLPVDLRLKALKERIDRRRLFREQLGLPPNSQDLQDEADVRSILSSSNGGPNPLAGAAAEPGISNSCTTISNPRLNVSHPVSGLSVHERDDLRSSGAAQPESDQGPRQPGDPPASSNIPEGTSVGNVQGPSTSGSGGRQGSQPGGRRGRGKRKRDAHVASGETGDEVATQDESSICMFAHSNRRTFLTRFTSTTRSFASRPSAPQKLAYEKPANHPCHLGPIQGRSGLPTRNRAFGTRTTRRTAAGTFRRGGRRLQQKGGIERKRQSEGPQVGGSQRCSEGAGVERHEKNKIQVKSDLCASGGRDRRTSCQKD